MSGDNNQEQIKKQPVEPINVQTTTQSDPINVAPLQQTTSQIQTELTDFQLREMARWDTVSGFKMKSGETDILESSYRKDYDKLNLFELRDALKKDKKSQSVRFAAMVGNVDILLRMSQTGGRDVDEKGKNFIRDFGDTLFAAKQSVHDYLTYQRDRTHIFDNGKRRLDIAERLEILLDQLSEKINERMVQMPEEKKRRAQYKSENLSEDEIKQREIVHQLDAEALDTLRIIETGEFGPKMDEETKKKVQETWLAGNFTKELKKLLNAPDKVRTKEEKNEFLAKLIDKNNLLLANKVTILTQIESAGKVTMGMPWLEEDLKKYVTDRLTSEDYLTLQPQEIAVKTKELIDQYSGHYASELSQLKERRDKVLKLIPLPGGISEDAIFFDIYSYPQMQTMMIESTDEEFEVQYRALLEKVTADEHEIQEVLSKKYSAVSCKAISKRLNSYMVGLRLFGDSEKILTQLGLFQNEIQFLASNEFKAERMLESVVKSLKIPKYYKDSLLKKLTGGDYESFLKHDTEYWIKEGKTLGENYKANSSAHDKVLNGRRLPKFIKKIFGVQEFTTTKELWDKLDDLEKKAVEMTPQEYKDALDKIVKEGELSRDKKLTKEEQLTRRRFNEAEKQKQRKVNSAYERDRISQIGDSCKDRFLLQIAQKSQDSLSHYRKVDSIYKHTEAFERQQSEFKKIALKEVYKERRDEFKKLLSKHNVPDDKVSELENDFKWLLEDMYSTDADLHEDERLTCERMNLENYGVRTFEEALLKIESYIPALKDGDVPEEVKKAEQKLQSGITTIKEFEGGVYMDIADVLTEIPEVYQTIMNKDQNALKDLLENNLAPKLVPILKAKGTFKEKESFGEGTYRNYLFTNLKKIYSGDIAGDEKFYVDQLKEYANRMYAVRIGANFENIRRKLHDQMEKEFKEANPKSKKKYDRDNTVNISRIVDVLYTMQLKAEDPEVYEEILDPEKALTMAKRILEERKDDVKAKDVQVDSAIKDAVQAAENNADLKNLFKDREEARKDVTTRIHAGKYDRTDYLDLDFRGLKKTSLGKSLVRVGEKGAFSVSVNKKHANMVRDAITKQCDFVLPPVLRDALIEYAAVDDTLVVEDYITKSDTAPMDGDLYRHAYRMNALYQNLIRDIEGSNAMSAEEAQMFIVRIFSDRRLSRGYFDDGVTNDKTPISFEEIRKSNDFKVFRQNYAKLKEFDDVEYSDASLQREQAEISKNLRMMLVTGVGLNKKDEKGKKINYAELNTSSKLLDYNKEIRQAIERHQKYMYLSAKVEQLIRAEVSEFRKKSEDPSQDKSIGFFLQEQEILALRKYFTSDLIKELKDGTEYNEESWKNKIKETYGDDNKRRYLLTGKDSISSKDMSTLENAKMDGDVDEAFLAKSIENSAIVFHGRSNRYQELDEDQKKFFALGLMMMDRGAIGYGTNGTSELLQAQKQKKINAEQISAEIQKYIRGEEFHININYKEAFFKLFDVDDFALIDELPMSKDAFEKAMSFAKTIYSKKQKYQMGEKDMDRVRDGYASIETAYHKSGKSQLNEVDKLQSVPLTKESVISRLIDYAKKDQISKSKMLIGGGIALVGGGVVIAGNVLRGKDLEEAKKKFKEKGREEKDAELDAVEELVDSGVATLGLAAAGLGAAGANDAAGQYKKVASCLRRLEKLANNEEETRLFLRIMQDRTVLDDSTGDPSEHADQEQRDLLFNALTGDANIAASTLSGYEDNASCHQALVNALSFQLRDDMFFKGKVLGPEHYANGALQRTTTIDWDLIEKAFKFMDDILDRRATVQATTRASEFIRQAGNKDAIKELDELEQKHEQDKKSFGREEIEKKLEEQALKATNIFGKEDEEVQRAWAGYQSLTDQEKNLFFKVLQRRDLLDISKKDYVKSFFGISDRNFLNATGRSKLLDEYIQTSLGDGVGVTLNEDAHYQAMKTLLSTQVSDIVNHRKMSKDLSGKVTGIFSYERFGFFGRGTAIDWKLFKRALNFVNRAKNELKTHEGNSLLYQGAGDIEKNGHMDVDYSFLRRNFHKTGNQWARFVGKLAAKRAKEAIGLDGTLNTIVGLVDAAKAGLGALGVNDGPIGKGLEFVAKYGKEAQSFSKSLDGQTKSQFEALKVNTEKEQKEADKTEAQKEADKKKAKEKEEKRRAELKFYDQMEEGFNNIIAEKKSVEGAIKQMETFLTTSLSIHLRQEFGQEEAKADKKNLVEQNQQVHDEKKGDIRDTYEKARSVTTQIGNIWDRVDSVPFANNLKKLLANKVKDVVLDDLVNKKLLDGKSVEEDSDGNPVLLTKDEKIKKLEEKAMEAIKDNVESMFKNVFGEEFAKNLQSFEQVIYDSKKFISDGIGYITKGIGYAQRCTAHVKNIAQSIGNMKKLSQGQEDALSHSKEDQEKLEKAGEKRLSEKQLEKAKQTHEMHQGLGDMSKTIAEAMQVFGIASDVINMAVDTANTFGEKLQYGTQYIANAVQDGLEFVMFALRVMTDRSALQDYLFTTPEGRRIVTKAQNGFKKSKGTNAQKNARKLDSVMKDYSLFNQAKNVDVLDIISDAQGYEHTSELVEDVGMSMAQSIVFCASKFNPMMETKLMAITVMTVMGMKADIGNISPATVSKLFNNFKMSR
nr:hypothetical protein [uncultured Butyrivibrio sp.]